MLDPLGTYGSRARPRRRETCSSAAGPVALGRTIIRVCLIWLSLLSFENSVAFFGHGDRGVREHLWIGAQLFGVPVAVALLTPLAAAVVVLGQLVGRRRAGVVAGVLAAVAAGFAVALSTGPEMSSLARRIPFVLAAGLLTFAASFVAVRRVPLERRRLLAVVAGIVAAGAWFADRRVLPGLYPAFHLALELVVLVATAGLVLVWRPSSTRSVAVNAVIGCALTIWSVVGFIELQLDPDLRQALMTKRPILGRVVLNLMRARSMVDGGWDIAANVDERDPDVARFFNHASTQRALDWTGCDILLVTVDALRADHVGAYGYARPTTPNIDRLAARGMRFDRAYASAPTTSFSITSLMAGRNIRPTIVKGAPMPAMWADHARTAGYATFAAFPAEVLRVDDRFAALRTRSFGFVQVFELTGETVAAHDELARTLTSAGADRPVFAWVHALEPHSPYVQHADHAMPGDGDIDAYDSEFAAVDAIVGKLIDLMRTRERCAVTILTGDHGESFGEHDAVSHGTHVYEEQVRVPLVVVGPGVASGVSRAPAQLIDLVPTVLSAIGRPRPAGVLGRDLGPTLAGRSAPSEAYAFAETSRYTMTAVGNDRLICDREARGCSLYDIVADPGENRPIRARADRVRVLRKLTSVLQAAEEPPIQLPWRRAATDPVFGRGFSLVEGDEVVATGVDGTVMYGPYIKVPAGSFEVVWRGRPLSSTGELAFSVRSNRGSVIAAYSVVEASSLPASGELIRIPFVLDRPRFEVELVVESDHGGRVAIGEVELLSTGPAKR